MNQQEENIELLLKKLNLLLKRQEDFSREINSLKNQITQLKETGSLETAGEAAKPAPITKLVKETAKEEVISPPSFSPPPIPQQRKPIPEQKKPAVPKVKGDLEKFIGENLISKIGIIITVIGVVIGAKYSIENDLISPLTRIILGYLAGIGLLGFGMKLKKKYENYSAVLVSGAIAILYFITFAAYDFYSLIPQAFAFAMMVIFTAFSVVAALNYNRQVIALIGLVGAYAIPFLLSDGSGKVGVLFSYMAIINVGILIISFRKYWKPLYYTAFGFTWIIYFSWFAISYKQSEHFGLALLFLSIFFITFYMTFLAYKLIKKEKLSVGSVIVLLFNAFIFYGIGYALLNDHETGKELLGLFTLGNAIVHFIVSMVIYKKKLANKNLFYLISALVLTFITITFPVQLDGNWVTLLWVAEAALLFWLGRTKKIPVYEKLSYPLMILAFFSIVHDWEAAYYDYYIPLDKKLTPLLNIQFLTSIIFVAAFALINYIHHHKNYTPPFTPGKFFAKAASFFLAGLLIVSLYWTFRLEIFNYWNQLYVDSALEVKPEDYDYPINYNNYDLRKFSSIWILNYSLLFMALLSVFSLVKLKDRFFGFVAVSLSIFTLFTFLTQGLYVLGQLRENYLDQTLAEYYKIGFSNVTIRYASFALVALVLFTCYKHTRASFMKWDFKMGFDLLLHITVLWIASSELINWMDLGNSEQSYKLGLSILWGIYALWLIALGIWKKKKHLRIGAIILFGITLIKLFFYDISHLNTIAKTVVFVSLGVLLLIISFLYNKYKHIISDEAKE
ncbi:DUF2339 domain-containing protein [Ascidiimonas sp. W6]|uniref:DUF2339 domain-containing protein n=1 Tax=Ascidiimonas meishanensis TaxID=3128903 RepID=UPI0030EC00C4